MRPAGSRKVVVCAAAALDSASARASARAIRVIGYPRSRMAAGGYATTWGLDKLPLPPSRIPLAQRRPDPPCEFFRRAGDGSAQISATTGPRAREKVDVDAEFVRPLLSFE